MRFIAHSKRIGLLFAGLAIAISSNLVFFVPAAHAANARWLNRAVVSYDDGGGVDYYIDSDPFDNIFHYIGLKRSDSGNCQPNELWFNNTSGQNAIRSNFYYANSEARDASVTEYRTWARQGGTGPNSNACVQKLATNSLSVDEAGNRRITYIRSADNQTIRHIFTGDTFTRNGEFVSEPGKPGHPRYISGDGDLCKDTILDVNNDPRRDEWFGPGQIPGSAMLFVAKDNDDNLDKTSESMSFVLDGTGGAVCKVDGPSIEGAGAHTIIDKDSGESQLTSAGWRQNSSGVYELQVDSSRDESDDSYIIFLGDIANNTIPAAVTGGTPGTIPGAGPLPQTPDLCEDVSGDPILTLTACAILGTVQSLIEWAFGTFILPLLAIPPITTLGGLEPIWRNFLAIANILYIIVFFIIIFSQATSVGVSNYGIKRLLPRLIVVAILSNLSYYLCAIAVDFANALGAGISSLILEPMRGLPQTLIQFDDGFAGFMGGLATIGVGGAAIAASGGILAAAAAVAVPLALLIATTVFALMLRLVAIMAFIAFSPIIFIGFILPGTSRMASRITMGFFNLLWAGPIVMAFVSLSGFIVYIIGVALP